MPKLQVPAAPPRGLYVWDDTASNSDDNASDSLHRIRSPNAPDVLIIQGLTRHPGTIMVYRDIVQKHKYVFQNADCMSDKTVIATNIVKLVQEQSGRFLMKNTTITPDGNSSDSWWIALKDSVAIDETFQSLTYAATKLYQL